MRRTLANTPSMPVPLLTATAISQTEIDLSAVYVGIPFAATFSFEFSAAPNGPFSAFTPPVAGSTAAAYQDTTLSASQTRYYRVRVNCRDGRITGYSPTVNATTQPIVVVLPPTTRANPSYGAVFHGGPGFRYDNTTFQNYVTLVQSCVVMEWFPGWDSFATQTMKQICANLLAGPLNTQPFLYHDPFFNSSTFGPSANYGNTFTNNKWWLTNFPYPSGAVISPNGGSSRVSNITAGGPVVNGRDAPSYIVDYVLEYLITGGSALSGGGNIANPNIKGIYLDDMQAGVPGGAAGDWLRNGGPADYAYPNGAYAVAIRAAFLHLYNLFQTRSPYPILMGGNGGGTTNFTPVASDYVGKSDLIHLENMIGGGQGCIETASGANAFIAQYQKMMQTVKAGSTANVYPIFGHSSVRADGSDILTFNYTNNTVTAYSPPWQGARHGWAACFAMGDARYFCNPTDPFNNNGAGEPYSSALTRYFDWHSVNPVTGIPYPQASASTGLTGGGWLGAWVDGPQTTPFQNGMYRRRANNGEVWWNPRGNGARTINFGRTVRLINSAQDPKQNGSSVTTLSQADRDGIAVLY